MATGNAFTFICTCNVILLLLLVNVYHAILKTQRGCFALMLINIQSPIGDHRRWCVYLKDVHIVKPFGVDGSVVGDGIRRSGCWHENWGRRRQLDLVQVFICNVMRNGDKASSSTSTSTSTTTSTRARVRVSMMHCQC